MCDSLYEDYKIFVVDLFHTHDTFTNVSGHPI